MQGFLCVEKNSDRTSEFVMIKNNIEKYSTYHAAVGLFVGAKLGALVVGEKVGIVVGNNVGEFVD